MGGLSPKKEDVKRYYKENSHISEATSASQVFTSTDMNPLFDPSQIKLPREALDSALSPHSRPIILAEDVTGSMSKYILDLIQKRFPNLITTILNFVSYNPHIMFMGIGDAAASDRAPLQVTQFESDLRMLDQLQEIWLEGRGGWNSYESYILAWLFAGLFCKVDSYDKRKEKGFCFTFGDEEPTPHLTQSELKRVFGKNTKVNPDDPRSKDLNIFRHSKITNSDCLRMASEKFYCYHIILHGNGYSSSVVSMWKNILHGHACDLSDHTHITELVCAILCMYEGHSKSVALDLIEDPTARRIVRDALRDHEENVELPPIVSANTASDSGIEVF